MSRPHVHKARMAKAYFACMDHALAGRAALARAQLADAEREEQLYEEARRARAEGRRAG